MCLGVNKPIATNVDSLIEARKIARQNQGSEVIIEQANGNYTVTKLTPEEMNKVKDIKNANFTPSKVEFMMENENGENNVVINPNASFLDRAQSKATNGLEIVDNARKNIMNTITTLVDNLTDRNNDYVWGGRTDFDPEKGISNVDCSGLLNSVFRESGLKVPDMTTEDLDTYIKNGQGILRQDNNASKIKYGDVINYPPQGKKTGHVMIAAGIPEPVVRNGQIVGYKLLTFDSAPDNSGSRRLEGKKQPELGRKGAGYREIFLFTDKNGMVTGLNTMGSESKTGGYHGGVRIGVLKDNIKVKPN